MKILVISSILCCAVVSGAVLLKKNQVQVGQIKVSYPKDEQKIKQIPVKVTLTKFQLRKMLDILEQDNNLMSLDGKTVPALDQDVYTFKSIAKGSDGEFSISSTHLSRK
jgi:hypothetical protein|tara:strand:+ start:68 stop:394 length:327 start_codon:yes stop_codon:yes gene_type:complete